MVETWLAFQVMRWEVFGADRATGDEHVFTVDAADEREATLIAKKKNLVVSNVILISQDESAKEANAPEPLHEPTPEYKGIQTGAAIVIVLAFASGVVGLVELVIGLFTLINASVEHGDNRPAVAVGTNQLAQGVTALVFAGLLWLASEIALAVRDVARNSFRDSIK